MKLLPVNQKKVHGFKKKHKPRIIVSNHVGKYSSSISNTPPKCPIILKTGKKWKLYRTSQLDNLDLNSCFAKLIAVYSLTAILKLSESCSCIK